MARTEPCAAPVPTRRRHQGVEAIPGLSLPSPPTSTQLADRTARGTARAPRTTPNTQILGGIGLFIDEFDGSAGEQARRAAALQSQAARLARQCQKAARDLDLHELRRRAGELAERAAEASAAANALQEAVAAFSPLPADAAASAEEEAAWASAFVRECGDLQLTLTGSYPDYHLFPFDIHIRLREERALFGRRASYRLRPAALAAAVRHERDRIFGGGFNAARFGRSLVRAYTALTEHLPATRPEVRLAAIYGLFTLGNFGRGTYTRDQFAFDLYRFRMTPMETESWRIVLTDQREARATSFEVPNGRGGTDRLGGLRLLPLQGVAAAAEAAAAPEASGRV